MLAAGTQAVGSKLQAKRGRPSKLMIGLMPAGSGKLDGVPARRDFEAGAAGTEQWAAAVEKATVGFSEAQRAFYTFREHQNYVVDISDWCEDQGIGAFVKKAEEGDDKVFGAIAPLRNEDGSIKVMPPQALLSMMSMMGTGDLGAAKGRRKLKRIGGARGGVARERLGEGAHGAAGGAVAEAAAALGQGDHGGRRGRAGGVTTYRRGPAA